jgi:hypothetical protein
LSSILGKGYGVKCGAIGNTLGKIQIWRKSQTLHKPTPPPTQGRLPAPFISMSNDYRSQVPHSLAFALCIAWVGCLARKKNPMGLAWFSLLKK